MRFNFTPFQILVHLASLSQFALLVFDFFTDNLTVNPIQYVTQKTGKAALTLLCLSLACTPAVTLGFKSAAKVRRPLGVYACLYASFHFLTFVGLDYGFDLGLIYEAIFKKPYALVGFSAFLILLPMALTSTQGWMKRLGKKWKGLHRWVYLAGILVVIHYLWLVKSDIREPLIYGAIVVFLLLMRISRVRAWASRFQVLRMLDGVAGIGRR
ncbi:MAG: protein-methionine-sulfoxide reductase heme-binding subunit MsrQ [Chloroflexota bacterium]